MAASTGTSKLARCEIEDAPEAADVMGALDGQAEEREIGEVGIEGGLGVARQEAPPDPLLRRPLDLAVEGDAGALERVGQRSGPIDHDRGARVLGEVRRVPGEVRDEEGGSAGSVGGEGNQRGIGVAVPRIDGGERSFESAAHKAPCGAGDLLARGHGLRLIHLRHNDNCCIAV